MSKLFNAFFFIITVLIFFTFYKYQQYNSTVGRLAVSFRASYPGITLYLSFFITLSFFPSLLTLSLSLSLLGGLAISFRAAYPSVHKMIGGIVFPIALIFILFLGGGRIGLDLIRH
jgi:uncharacterized membrane protein